MIVCSLLIFCQASLTLCYQRISANTNRNEHKDTASASLTNYPNNDKWKEVHFDMTMPKNITALVGTSAYLGCRVKNLNNRTLAWIRHRDLHILTVGTYTYTTDQRFQTSYHREIDEWTLQIKWAQKRDAGIYECQVSTQPVKSFQVKLKIVVPTGVILGGPEMFVHKGSTVNLTCLIKFSPEPPTHLFWYHQDQVVKDGDRGGRLEIRKSDLNAMQSVLLIHNADLLDSGKYSCYPSNTKIASIRIHVLQGEQPEAMQTNSGGSHIFYECCILLTLVIMSKITAAYTSVLHLTAAWATSSAK